MQINHYFWQWRHPWDKPEEKITSIVINFKVDNTEKIPQVGDKFKGDLVTGVVTMSLDLRELELNPENKCLIEVLPTGEDMS